MSLKTDVIRSFTFSLLCLTPIFQSFGIVHLPELNYYRRAPYTLMLPAVAGAAVLILGILFACATVALRRLASARTQSIIFAGAALLLIPAAGGISYSAVAGRIALVCVLIIARRCPDQPSCRDCRRYRPFPAFVLSAHPGWHSSVGLLHPASRIRICEYVADQSSEPPLPAKGARIIWLVFDELDYELTFHLRPSNVEMPALDRLRSESVSVTGAKSAEGTTLESMPAMFLGQHVELANPISVSKVQLSYGKSESGLWNGQSSVFVDANEAGLRTALIGWYHAYCRIFSSTVDYCESYLPLDGRESLYYEALFMSTAFPVCFGG